MALESGTYINSLNAANPASTDGLGQADDHIRLIKSTIKATFPNLDGPVTATQGDLNNTGSIPTTLTDLGITDGNNGQVLKTDGSGNFSFFTLPAGSTDTNYYVTGGSFSGTTLTLTRNGGLGDVTITDLPAEITDNNQISNGAGYLTSSSALNTDKVTAATAGLSLGDVGSYSWIGSDSNTTFTAGTTYSGSNLKYAGFLSETVYSDNTANTIRGAGASGTWRAMGTADSVISTSARKPSTLFLKILA